MRYDAVFHFDQDAATLALALANIRNYFDGLTEESFTAVLLVNGPGITCMGKTSPQADQIQELADRGLSVRVCQNAMRSFNLMPEWLHPACRIVPAGVIELVQLERAGFAYIKP